jgi:hypothetical protein
VNFANRQGDELPPSSRSRLCNLCSRRRHLPVLAALGIMQSRGQCPRLPGLASGCRGERVIYTLCKIVLSSALPRWCGEAAKSPPRALRRVDGRTVSRTIPHVMATIRNGWHPGWQCRMHPSANTLERGRIIRRKNCRHNRAARATGIAFCANCLPHKPGSHRAPMGFPRVDRSSTEGAAVLRIEGGASNST